MLLLSILFDFNPPAPCGAGRFPPRTSYPLPYFNPPAPCGAGLFRAPVLLIFPLFQSTRPVRGGTNKGYIKISDIEFQSTRPVRGGTLLPILPRLECLISIHPPRAGRDFPALSQSCLFQCISIHPPRAGRDALLPQPLPPQPQFQSTRPVRGGTSRSAIHASSFFLFQSTRPVRGGTINSASSPVSPLISIHPPRAGRDMAGINWRRRTRNFNPPAPCGAGLCHKFGKYNYPEFQSTRPVRGGTAEGQEDGDDNEISIHPPRAGRDIIAWRQTAEFVAFQSTRPVRGGT